METNAESEAPRALSEPQVMTEWLSQHIPHRIRASLALSPLLGRVLDATGMYHELKTNAWRDCMATGAWEGRLASMRWLIEFVGIEFDEITRGPKDQQSIRGRKLKARGKKSTAQFDVDIEDLPDGTYFPIEKKPDDAKFLAEIWKGCSQACSHATFGSNHPPVGIAALERAQNIVFNHLDETVYASQEGKCLQHSLRF